jgi:hypothetical protein
MNNADRMRKQDVPHQEGALLWQEAVAEKRRIHRSCYTGVFLNRDVRPLLSIRGLKAAALALCTTLSAFSSFPKNGGVVLVSVSKESVFRWVPWRKARRNTFLPCRPLVPDETHVV